MGISLNGAPGAVSLGSAPAAARASGGGPYTAYVTGTMPTDTETYQTGTLNIYDSDGIRIYTHAPTYRGRGTSTWAAPKKPFKVRSSNTAQRPFGFSASRDWALMADYFDQSYIRSTVAYEIARRATGRWAPLSRPVRLLWNGVYQGLYRYSETADVQIGRVAIRKMSNSDTSGNALTGPYYLETNHPLDDAGWVTARGTNILYDTPDVIGVTAQETYIQSWVDAFETTLITGTEAEFLAKIDLSSWVDWYLFTEATKNVDAQWERSCKWYKDQDAPGGTGKVFLWPPWDYDLALGLHWPGDEESATGWSTRVGPNAGGNSYPNWLYYAWQRSPVFRAAVRARWASTFKPVLESIGTFVDTRAAEVAPLVTEDRAKWYSGTAVPTIHTAAWIKSWIATRTSWIHANLPTEP